MISASDGPPAVAGVKLPDDCVEVAAISMPPSSAAVLTLISTPVWLESCADEWWEGSAETPEDEGDSDVRVGLRSSAIARDSSASGATAYRAVLAPLRDIGYHARHGGINGNRR